MKTDYIRISILSWAMLLPTETSSLQDLNPSDAFLKEMKVQLHAFTSQHIQENIETARALEELLGGRDSLDVEVDRMKEYVGPRDSGVRRRRQVMAPDLSALQSSYSSFFGGGNRRHHKPSKKRKKKKPNDDEMPIVLVPEESTTECISNNQLSSFGFLGFVLNVVNAVINVANNINNNDNSNNDNDNNNNNNDANTNQVGITETATNDNPPVIAVAGRRIQRLKMMQTALKSHIHRLEDYRSRRRRSTSDATCDGFGKGEDVVDEAIMASMALIDMWKEVLFEDDPACMALEFCDTSSKLQRFSRLAGMMAQVASVAAANMLLNFQGVNPEYLIKASEAGAEGENCTLTYHSCFLKEDELQGRHL